MKPRDNCITIEEGHIYVTVNGQKLPAERVRFLSPDQIEGFALRMIEAGASIMALGGSISPPRHRPRRYRADFRCVDYTT